ncbi:MAG: type II secretion system F family protein [Anaerolineae bacterium]|jgi:tight adherence protein C|nr:type II secretion system F family protein [Anaerolineae bacterium]
MAGLLPLIIAMAIGLSIVLIFIGISMPRPADQIQERLVEYGGRPLTLEEIELSQPFSERIIKPLIRGMANLVLRLAPSRNMEALQRKLEMAGRPNNWSPAEFMGVRGLAGILLGVMGFMLMTLAKADIGPKMMIGLAMAGLGYYLPTAWLGSKIKQRQHNIIKALPDALDLLTISVEAGLGFDAALAKVTEKWDNELTREFMRVIAEMRVGKKRRDALRDMAARVDIPDVTTFVAAIVQAEQLGVSIAKVLRIQSEQMRIKRRQRAEELARKAPLKMMFPLVFLIFPAIWIVLMGPAILIVKNSGVIGNL